MSFYEREDAGALQESIETYNKSPNSYSYSAVERVAGHLKFLFLVMAALAFVASVQG